MTTKQDLPCRICGDRTHGTEYRERSGMRLCDVCHEETPAKVGFRDFCKEYFGKYPEDLKPQDRRTHREFYDDYRTSTYGDVEAYANATTSICY